MIELELLGADGDRVVMTDEDGQRYSIVVDDALRAAVRRARPAALAPVPEPSPGAHVRPRDLQALMRAGASAQEVAQATGLDVEHVQRFEGPVRAERTWAVEQARSCRIGWEKDSPVLGELVIDRLATRGVEPSSLHWDAFREGREPWQILLTFIQGAEEKQALWELDLSAHSVSALDDEARWLTEASLTPRTEVFNQDAARFTSRMLQPRTGATPVIPNPAEQPAGPAPTAAERLGHLLDASTPLEAASHASAADLSATDALLADLAKNRGQRATPLEPVDDDLTEVLEDEADPAGLEPSPTGDAPEADAPIPGEPSAVTSQAQIVSMTERRRAMTEALTGHHPAGSKLEGGEAPLPVHEVAEQAERQRAAQTPLTAVPAVSTSDAPPQTPAAQAAASEDASEPAPSTGTQEALPDMPQAPAKPKKRSSRRSVPSWDEIVFGAKPE